VSRFTFAKVTIKHQVSCANGLIVIPCSGFNTLPVRVCLHNVYLAMLENPRYTIKIHMRCNMKRWSHRHHLGAGHRWMRNVCSC